MSRAVTKSWVYDRLQNSPGYKRAFKRSKKRSGVRVKTESETGCALQENITPAIWAFQTDFEKKTDCFAV